MKGIVQGRFQSESSGCPGMWSTRESFILPACFSNKNQEDFNFQVLFEKATLMQCKSEHIVTVMNNKSKYFCYINQPVYYCTAMLHMVVLLGSQVPQSSDAYLPQGQKSCCRSGHHQLLLLCRPHTARSTACRILVLPQQEQVCLACWLIAITVRYLLKIWTFSVLLRPCLLQLDEQGILKELCVAHLTCHPGVIWRFLFLRDHESVSLSKLHTSLPSCKN